MLDDFYPSDEYETDGWNARPKTSQPDGILEDPDLTTAEKREILASWASDARAVVDAPALRQLDDGTLFDIDTILNALKQLDGEPVARLSPRPRTPDRFARRRAFASPMRRLAQRWRRDDNDDDPPPCPAGARAPRLTPGPAGDAVAAA